MKVLFILKENDCYGHPGPRSSGLYNSAVYCAQALCAAGQQARIVQVVDNNDIDREVSKYRPTHVIIEALWVVPSKFDILSRLHPNVKWVVRIHSKWPFLASEGIAVYWINGYILSGNFVAFNDWETKDSFSRVLGAPARVLYLPNCYCAVNTAPQPLPSYLLNVCCMGAIRPLKNQVIQAVAAITCANKLDRTLHFHINSSRVEMAGENVVKNLRALFADDPRHSIVEHGWMEPDEWRDFLGHMDLGMQVSLSETFNIVSADTVSAGVPIVVSSEIPWAKAGIADPSDCDDISDKMLTALKWSSWNVSRNRSGLASYAKDAAKTWVKELGRIA